MFNRSVGRYPKISSQDARLALEAYRAGFLDATRLLGAKKSALSVHGEGRGGIAAPYQSASFRGRNTSLGLAQNRLAVARQQCENELAMRPDLQVSTGLSSHEGKQCKHHCHSHAPAHACGEPVRAYGDPRAFCGVTGDQMVQMKISELEALVNATNEVRERDAASSSDVKSQGHSTFGNRGSRIGNRPSAQSVRKRESTRMPNPVSGRFAGKDDVQSASRVDSARKRDSAWNSSFVLTRPDSRDEERTNASVANSIKTWQSVRGSQHQSVLKSTRFSKRESLVSPRESTPMRRSSVRDRSPSGTNVAIRSLRGSVRASEAAREAIEEALEARKSLRSGRGSGRTLASGQGLEESERTVSRVTDIEEEEEEEDGEDSRARNSAQGSRRSR